MAKIEQTTVIETVTTEVKRPAYILTLSQNEAETLVAVLDRVGGHMNGSHGYADAVLEALIGANVYSGNRPVLSKHEPNPAGWNTDSHIYFTDGH
jgi:hypothetical protein